MVNFIHLLEFIKLICIFFVFVFCTLSRYFLLTLLIYLTPQCDSISWLTFRMVTYTIRFQNNINAILFSYEAQQLLYCYFLFGMDEYCATFVDFQKSPSCDLIWRGRDLPRLRRSLKRRSTCSKSRVVAATKFCCRDKDFHENSPVHTKRFVAAMCRRIVLLQLVAWPVHTE